MFACIVYVHVSVVHFACFQFTWLAGLAVSYDWFPALGLHTLSATVLCISCMLCMHNYSMHTSLCHCYTTDELHLTTGGCMVVKHGIVC